MSTTPEPTTPGPSPADLPPVTDTSSPEAPLTGSPVPEPEAGQTTAPEAGRDQPDLRPLYAVAGLTDLVVGAVRSTLVDTQHWASARISELRFRQAELEKQAAELRERADDLPEQVKTLPEVTRTRVGDLQQQASHAYADLAGRGQRVVQGVAGRVDPVFDRVQESVDKARRLVTGRGAGGATPGAGSADIIVPTATLTPEDDLGSAPSGMPDEALVAEEIYLVESTEPGSMVDEDLTPGSRTDDDGETTSER
jgi:hypothetical protein